MKKSPQDERKIILSRPEKRPYGVRIQFRLKTIGDIGNLENACILLDTGSFLTISPGKKAPWEGGEVMKIDLEGFSTAAAAEQSGRKLVQALLWTSIKNKSPLQLQYQSYKPTYIFERNRSQGLSCSAYSHRILNTKNIVNCLHDNYLNLPETEPSLLLSMEIFAGSKLETSERAIFLSMVSALEPLAKTKRLGEEVNQFIKTTIKNLKSCDNVPSAIHNSLTGRLNQLRNESIRQALKRMAIEIIPEITNASMVIDEAYNIRSQIVHNGQPSDLDIDFNEKLQGLEEVIVAIYKKKMLTSH